MQAETSSASLSPGALIGRYEIREVLGIGGFGITYKANDTKLKRLVAIKEYLPAETAVRAHNSSIVNAYESREDEYQYGLERFLDEAKTLAKFHHPNIIGVLDHLELNNTAYLIMTYEQGQTLSQLLKRQGKIPELELKAIVKAILTGLHHIHEQDYYHRDIKPGNIYLRKQGEPALIDFGAARQAIGARSRSLTNIVSAGYAPSEQYGSNQSKQGAWSDLYAVGATMYKSISGQEPSDAPTRQNALFEQDPDPLTPAIEIAKGHYTEELLQLIDWMLAPAIKNRPQNVHQVLGRLNHSEEKDESRSTEITAINQEARSTQATRIVTAKEYQQTTEEAPNYYSDKDSQTNEPQVNPQKTKTKLFILGISLITLIVIGISQKQKLYQLVNNIAPLQNEPREVSPTHSASNQTTEREKQNQKALIQSRVEQELKKRQQQQIQVQQAEQARLAELEKLKQQEQAQALAKEQQVQQAQKLQSIQSLLSQAENDIKQMRLSSPRGNNAVDKYQQVLQLEANNQLALKGLTAIIEKYLAMAETAQQQKHYQKARQLLKKAKIIQPENNEITLAERQLNTAETSYQQEQAKLAEQAKQRQAEKARLAAQRIKIGSTGPSGGIVFYVDSSGKHGLEAKSSDYTKQPGDMDYKDGAYYTWTHAVTAGKSYGSGWHLPSKRELNLLYKQKDVVGGFAKYGYWSSTESGSGVAWLQGFYIGFQLDSSKYGPNRVRAVRAF